MADFAALFRGRRLILLDFDGPLCAAFGPGGAAPVAHALRAFAANHGLHLGDQVSTTDPLATLRTIDQMRPDLTSAADAELRHRELLAVLDAVPTDGAAEFLQVASSAGRIVAIVSNNATDAIKRYVDTHQLGPVITNIQGRPVDISRMKPDPWLLNQALIETGRTAADALMIGDSTSDIEAAHALAIPCLGLANKPSKHQRLQAAGADALVSDMRILAAHVTDR